MSEEILRRLPRGTWTKEKCILSASYYKTIAAWCKERPGAYNAAYKNNWLDECCAHMKFTMETKDIKPRGYWTLERCKASARLYPTKKVWEKSEGSSYVAAQRNGWIDLCCEHMMIHKEIIHNESDPHTLLPRLSIAIGMCGGACFKTPLLDDGTPDFSSWKKISDFENVELCEYIRKNYEVTDDEQRHKLSQVSSREM
jgi:hypothetical protein